MDDVRLQCVIDSLSIFGENSKAAMMARLNEQGISFIPGKFQIEKFCIVVRQFLGDWSDFIFMKITDDICKRSHISLENLGLSGRAKFLTHFELLVEVFLKIEALQNERRTEP